MAQLKSTNITGNLSVTGNILASKIIKLGGTTHEVLLADGTIARISTTNQTVSPNTVTTTAARTYIVQKNGDQLVVNVPWVKGESSGGTLTEVNLVGGDGIALSSNTIDSDSDSITISHDDTSDQDSIETGGRTYINSITLDDYGHVTSLGTGTETVTAYSLPLASSSTRGGIKIGFSSTENNRALLLSSEKAYISLPTRLADYSTSGYGDANEATAQGWHYMTTNATNRPPFKQSSNKDYRIMSTAYSSSWVQQIATDFRGNDMFLRRRENGTWKPWTPIVRFQDCTADHKMQTITDNAIARWDSGGTAMLQNSGATIDDSGNITATSFKKSGGTDDDILMGNGSTISKQGLIDSLEAAMEGNSWRPVKYGSTTLNDTSTTLEFLAGSNIGLTFTGGKLTIANNYSYSLPLAANGTRGGIQIGYSETENNRALKLNAEKAYIELPQRLYGGRTDATAPDSALKSGFYYTSSLPESLGFSNNQGTMFVSSYNDDWVAQMVIGCYTDKLAYRKKGTSWTSWKTVATEDWVEGKGYLTSHQSLANYVTLDSAQTISGKKTFTGSMKVSGRYANSGDDEGIVIGRASNSYAGLCLGEPSGLRSVFYLTSNNQAIWRYNNGTTSYDIQHPGKTGTIALTSDIPAISGFVTGPSNATNNAIALFDGTGGKTIKNSGLIVDTNSNLTGLNTLNCGEIKFSTESQPTISATKLGPGITVDGIETAIIYAPTTSGGTTYSVGSNGQVLKSNGNTVYWGTDNSGSGSDQKTSSSNQTSTKLYIVGAQSVSTSGVTTYTNSGCYIGTDNCLYSNGKKVATEEWVEEAVNDTIDSVRIYSQAQLFYTNGTPTGNWVDGYYNVGAQVGGTSPQGNTSTSYTNQTVTTSGATMNLRAPYSKYTARERWVLEVNGKGLHGIALSGAGYIPLGSNSFIIIFNSTADGRVLTITKGDATFTVNVNFQTNSFID